MAEPSFIRELSERRRFGMKPGLDTIRALCAHLGNPERRFSAVHVAGTNGKGAVCAILDAVLRKVSNADRPVARYTSPHLVKLNERFFVNGLPIADAALESAAERVRAVITDAEAAANGEVTFFEALTATAFVAFAEARVCRAVLECGLGGRLDATNICQSELSVITRIGLDHCDWLGNTIEKIAAEKCGIIKPKVPVVLAQNEPSVVEIVRSVAAANDAPFIYAPDFVAESEVPAILPLRGAFNRENAITALAALKVLGVENPSALLAAAEVTWPGRYQWVGDVLVDGAHNPPAAQALMRALQEEFDFSRPKFTLIFGACGDKDALTVLKTLAPAVRQGLAVPIDNARGLSPEATAALMRDAGITARAVPSLKEALAVASADEAPVLVCGSLFLAGAALMELGAYPWQGGLVCPSEQLVRAS